MLRFNVITWMTSLQKEKNVIKLIDADEALETLLQELSISTLPYLLQMHYDTQKPQLSWIYPC